MDSVVVSQQGVNVDYQTKYGQLRQVNFLCIAVRRLISYASALYLYPHFGNVHTAISLAVRTFYIQTGNHPDICTHYGKNKAKMY